MEARPELTCRSSLCLQLRLPRLYWIVNAGTVVILGMSQPVRPKPCDWCERRLAVATALCDINIALGADLRVYDIDIGLFGMADHRVADGARRRGTPRFVNKEVTSPAAELTPAVGMR